jgi:hypothetical protein
VHPLKIKAHLANVEFGYINTCDIIEWIIQYHPIQKMIYVDISWKKKLV